MGYKLIKEKPIGECKITFPTMTSAFKEGNFWWTNVPFKIVKIK